MRMRTRRITTEDLCVASRQFCIFRHSLAHLIVIVPVTDLLVLIVGLTGHAIRLVDTSSPTEFFPRRF